jgi:lipoyl(octanoyl) transferase
MTGRHPLDAMTWHTPQFDPDATVAQFHLLGRVDFAAALALQQRLVFEAGETPRQQITVLLCEHPDVVTIGRGGSRAHIRISHQELTRRRLPVRWVGRGGGCILHSPGQLAVYPIAPLNRLRWTVGEFARRLQRGMLQALSPLGVRGETQSARLGIWGRTGQLVAFGLAVRDWVTYHGAFVNVGPAMNPYRYVDTAVDGPTAAVHGGKTTMSCLLAERGRAVTMTRVRSDVVAALSAVFECERYHLHTGHPLLASLKPPPRDLIARAS